MGVYDRIKLDMDYLKKVKREIEKVLREYTEEDINFSVDLADLERGDITTNVAMVAGKVIGKSPQQFGEILVKRLNKSLKEIVSKIEFVNPGFINLTLEEKFVKNNLSEKHWWQFLLKRKVVSKKYLGKHVLVEHSSPNLFKPFHIGHLVNNFTGEFIVRILKNAGAKVKVVSYPSDISIGIAKAIYMIKNDEGLSKVIFNKNEEEIVKYLSDCYVRGVSEYKKWEENNDQQKIREVKEIANNLYNNVLGEDLSIYEATKKINLHYLFANLKTLGSNFDGFIFESEAGIVGKKIIEKNIGNVFVQSEGAVVYVPSEERKDINTTVFINSEGNPTYAGKDIGLMDLKFRKYNPELSIFITDNEQNPHFRVVLDVVSKMKSDWAQKSLHVGHGRMTFKGAKMSSRLGGVPTSEDVINEVLQDVREKSDDKIKDLSSSEKENLQREVALSALRISILRSKPGTNIDFDPEKASSFEGDSGPYLCYTHARCASLIEHGEEKNFIPTKNKRSKVTNIERKILQFEYILRIAAEEIAPQKLVKYLFELASEFNSFYASNKIITLDEEVSEHNLYLTELTKDTLCKGLYLLGINAPARM